MLKQLKNPELEGLLHIAHACLPALQSQELPLQSLERATYSVVTACCPLGSQVVLIWVFMSLNGMVMKIMQCHFLEGPGTTDQVYGQRRENTVTQRDKKGGRLAPLVFYSIAPLRQSSGFPVPSDCLILHGRTTTVSACTHSVY